MPLEPLDTNDASVLHCLHQAAGFPFKSLIGVSASVTPKTTVSAKSCCRAEPALELDRSFPATDAAKAFETVSSPKDIKSER